MFLYISDHPSDLASFTTAIAGPALIKPSLKFLPAFSYNSKNNDKYTYAYV